MNQQEIIICHNLLTEDPESRIAAANYLFELTETKKRVERPEQALYWLDSFRKMLLTANRYIDCALFLWGTSLFDPRPQTVRRIWRSLNTYPKNLIMGASALGKCLGRGTKVVMFDGRIKNVEDILPGEELMGDDSTPRKVLSTTNGFGKLYRIMPAKGDSWVCNEHHILTLKSSLNKRNGDGKTLSSTYSNGRVTDIPIKDFINASKTFQHHFKQFSVPIRFEYKEVEYDPYIYGLWLGDGGVNNPVLHNVDPVIIKTWCDYFIEKGFRIVNSQTKHNRIAYFVRKPIGSGKTHKFKTFLRTSFIDKEKRILPQYLCNSEEIRLAVLAGLIDTDGWAQDSGFSICTKYVGLAEDIKFLCKSIGLGASSWTVKKRIKSLGFEGTYYTVYIGGKDIDRVPTKLKHPKYPKKTDKDPLCTSIKSIEPIGEGAFYGFETDGNHRFLLGDLTVTHNSFNMAAWGTLRYAEDPEGTNIKVVSTSSIHARANIWSTMLEFHRMAAIQMPGIRSTNAISIDPLNKHSAISIVAIPQGDDGRGRLQGFHPKPRQVPHPKFGPMTTVILMLDEGEDAPDGLWQGVDNMFANQDEHGSVKMAAATNPKDQSSIFAQKAMPMGGWDSFNLETNMEWESQEGFHVTRLDASKTENVIQKKIVYPGLQTYDGFMNLYNRGKKDPSLWTFGYGAYPQEGVEYQVVPPGIISNIIGTYNFIEMPTNWASFDGGFAEGGDDAVLTTGRCGRADSFTGNGKIIQFAPKWVGIAEQQFSIPRHYDEEGKANAILMGDDLIRILLDLHVPPEYFVDDTTGNGLPIHDYIRLKFGTAILGVQWGEDATELKILEEDSRVAKERYQGIRSEMWFAFRYWAEHGIFKIAPGVNMSKLASQLTSRKYSWISKTLQMVESKNDYKLRAQGQSPNEADSLIMAVQLLRTRGFEKPAMLPPPPPPEPKTIWDSYFKKDYEEEETTEDVTWPV